MKRYLVTKYPEKPVQLSIRVLWHEREKINQAAKDADMSVVGYIRKKLGLNKIPTENTNPTSFSGRKDNDDESDDVRSDDKSY